MTNKKRVAPAQRVFSFFGPSCDLCGSVHIYMRTLNLVLLNILGGLSVVSIPTSFAKTSLKSLRD